MKISSDLQTVTSGSSTDNINVRNNTICNPYLSKSLFIRGLQCHKALWLQKHMPELKDEVSVSEQAAFDSGNDVGILAQKLLPDGTLIPYDNLTFLQQIENTSTAIKEGKCTIYEAAFSHDSVFIKADILHNGEKGWELYEVKSSTGLKDVYLDDIAVQYYVLNGAGIKPEKAFLVHINRDYILDKTIMAKDLFRMVDVTESITARQPLISESLKLMRIMLQKEMPETDIGHHCDSPYKCPFKGYCWAHIPKNSVFDFRDTGKPDSFKLYRSGIIKMEDAEVNGLGWCQRLQLEGILYRKNHIDKEQVKSFINSLWYPLCFMDFETTYMNPVPLFDGTRPYQQVPFQFSLHIQDTQDSVSRHYEFLSDGKTSPLKDFMEHLISVVPDNACILTWNKQFEQSRLNELKDAFPENIDNIDSIVRNIRDLMTPFKNKSIYCWQFAGSYSLKAVLPVLVPELSYAALPINNGEMAASAWIRMIHSDDPVEKGKIRQHLLDYCHLDTYAMVRILEEMRRLIPTMDILKK